MRAARDLGIRPLGLGEVVDRAIALGLRHFRPLFATTLLLQAPAVALWRQQQARGGEVLGVFADPARAAELLRPAGVALGGLVALLLVLQLAATAAAAAIVAPSLDPRAAGGPGAGRRVLAVASAGAVQLSLLAAAPALGALPGLALAAGDGTVLARLVGVGAAAAGALLLLLLVLLRLLLVPAVAAVEGVGGFSAALRSARLMAPRAGRLRDRPGLRASLVLLATFLLATAVNGLAGLPRALLARLAGAGGPLGPLGPFAAPLPLAAEIPVSILEAAAAAAIQPFSLVAVAVLYYDRRARAEALDVERWAERLGARG